MPRIAHVTKMTLLQTPHDVLLNIVHDGTSLDLRFPTQADVRDFVRHLIQVTEEQTTGHGIEVINPEVDGSSLCEVAQSIWDRVIPTATWVGFAYHGTKYRSTRNYAYVSITTEDGTPVATYTRTR